MGRCRSSSGNQKTNGLSRIKCERINTLSLNSHPAMRGDCHHVTTIYHTIAPVSLFTFFVTGIFICTKPGACYQYRTYGIDIFYSSFTRLSRKQRLQLIYGPRRNPYRRRKRSPAPYPAVIYNQHYHGCDGCFIKPVH